jgi:hypothetical protein
MKAGICKLKTLRRGTYKGSCPLRKRDAKHELLRCPETKIRKGEFVDKKRLHMNEINTQKDNKLHEENREKGI